MVVEQAEPTIWQMASERRRETASIVSRRYGRSPFMCSASRLEFRLASMRNRYLVAPARLAILLE